VKNLRISRPTVIASVAAAKVTEGRQVSTHDLPPDVLGALQALHRRCADLHRVYGHATRALCCWWLSGDWGDDEQSYTQQFNEWFEEWDAHHPAKAQRHRDLVTQRVPACTFRAFFDFYLERAATEVRSIFDELVEIGRRHSLKPDVIAWAVAEVRQMVRDCRPMIREWFPAACDGPGADARSWRAPRWLRMKPAGREPYDPERAGERMDEASTEKVLDAFADEFVGRLEEHIADSAGAAYIRAAKQPKPPRGARMIRGSGGKKREPVLDLQALINRWKIDPEGATYSYAEAAHLLGVERHAIPRWIESEKLIESAAKQRRVTAESVMRLRNQSKPAEPQIQKPGR
jgi:hypothetical protein